MILPRQSSALSLSFPPETNSSSIVLARGVEFLGENEHCPRGEGCNGVLHDGSEPWRGAYSSIQ